MLILLRTLLSLVITPFKESVLKLVPKGPPNRLKTSKWYFIQLTIIIGTIGLVGSPVDWFGMDLIVHYDALCEI